MATFPTSITPKSISPFTYKFPKLLWEFDKGYISTRAKFSKPLRMFSWEFLGLNASEKVILTNFIEEVRGESLTFDITWPEGHFVVEATNTAPIEIRVQYYHNFFNGDTVNITGVEGNTAANGVWTISNADLNSFTLDYSTGNGVSFTSGVLPVVKLKLDNIKFVFDEGLSGEITKILGPDRDDFGIYLFTLDMEQIY